MYPRDEFGFRFVVLARRWRRFVDDRLAKSGLSDATWTPLVHLDGVEDGITQTELAARIGLDTSSLVRLLDILCARGLVERRVDSNDRRARRLHLTPAGKAEVTRIRRLLLAAEAELLSDSSDDEIADLLRVLDRIAQRIETLRPGASK
ncbi:MarR family winged helix-turn-helix transcriptional regulator [Brucella gallinifaecis]|uniref:MarR family transcriptional regulator n=1 Tax=Brucella gallinifaecis TaxID=215590 RepID=A0A502BL18_9HYPH|nr:MarR family transcriptional regulator [Brucella gallinifaecis]TPF74359.1 MarR family transcriptional regulator [Brucella gallinifaecis]